MAKEIFSWITAPFTQLRANAGKVWSCLIFDSSINKGYD
jgi:hypothetical protein